MTRGLAAAFALEALLAGAIALTALDIRGHARVENLGGVNIWGYRGPVVRTKRANEIRLLVGGGDLAFGWGVAPTETLAPYLRRLVALEVEVSGAAGRVVTATTAAARGLAPIDYAAWLEHFGFLHADALCLVLDPPDRAPARQDFLPDRGSLVFRRFGYSPILPLVLQEKGERIGSRTVRLAGSALATFDDLMADRSVPVQQTGAAYLDAIDKAAHAGLRVAPMGVVVVVPAPLADAPDYSAVATQLVSRFEGERRIRVVDLGRDRRLHDGALRLDGFSFAAAGHSAVAEVVTPAVIELVRAQAGSR